MVYQKLMLIVDYDKSVVLEDEITGERIFSARLPYATKDLLIFLKNKLKEWERRLR